MTYTTQWKMDIIRLLRIGHDIVCNKKGRLCVLFVKNHEATGSHHPRYSLFFFKRLFLPFFCPCSTFPQYPAIRFHYNKRRNLKGRLANTIHSVGFTYSFSIQSSNSFASIDQISVT